MNQLDAQRSNYVEEIRHILSEPDDANLAS